MGDARKMNTPGRNSESSIHTERVFSVLLQEWHPRRVNFYNFSSRPENTIFGRVSAGYAPEHTCAAGPKNEDFWRSYMANARKMADLEKIGCPKNGIFGSDILGNTIKPPEFDVCWKFKLPKYAHFPLSVQLVTRVCLIYMYINVFSRSMERYKKNWVCQKRKGVHEKINLNRSGWIVSDPDDRFLYEDQIG